MISLIVYILYLAIKKQQVTDENIVPLLGVIFVYMIGHSMIELNFIYIPYLLTFGIICGIISAQSAKPVENKVFTRINTAIIFLLSISNILLFLIK